jgi:hypothetical protein
MKVTSFFQKITAKAGSVGSPPPIQVPVLSEAVRIPYGPFRFKGEVVPGTPYEIQATTNFKKEWTTIASDISKGEFEYIDPEATKLSYRFYRLNANGVYSLNVVGYVTYTLAPGSSMVGNSFARTDYTVAELFKGMPEGTLLQKFDGSLYKLTDNLIKNGRWQNPIDTLELGEGAIITNPTSDMRSLCFSGEVMQGRFSTPIPKGFSIRCSPVPQPGRLDTDLNFPIEEGDMVHLFDRETQKCVEYSYSVKGWSPSPPIVMAGESFWVAKKSPGYWVVDFSVT